jgi:FixJ family two-component response regulator
MSEIESMSIVTMKGGSVVEQFNEALQRALENIVDPNTKAKAKRTVNLRLTILPDEERELLGLVASVTTSMAPAAEIISRAWVAHTRDGVVAAEHDPRQPGLDFDKPKKPVPLKAVDGGAE